MPSVTQRIEKVSQPYGGYVPLKLFAEKQYSDEYEVVVVPSAFKAIQGLAVDYLTRYIMTNNKLSAFSISIIGAKRVDEAFENNNETRNIMSLIERVQGLDDDSIYSTCRIVCYDVAARLGVEYFRPVGEVIPPQELIRNIRVLVNRCLAFFNNVGSLTSAGFTFEGGYTPLINSGDGDYLTKDTLIDLKTSYERFSSKWSLQLLVYYLMGIHSIHKEFATIDKLCIFNPIENKSYTVSIADIDDKSKYEVSNKVIGYKMLKPFRYIDPKTRKPIEDYSSWREINGFDEKVVLGDFRSNYCNTGFDVNKYDDGIFDITVDDYWTYYRPLYRKGKRPAFKNTERIKLVKHNGFIMFISISDKGVQGILNGASTRTINHPIEYYYDNIDKYARTVLAIFSDYWKALFGVSEQIHSLAPSEEYLRKKWYSEYLRDFEKMQAYFRSYVKNDKAPVKEPKSFIEWYNTEGYRIKPNGTVHGCIVDIDTTKHVYLNPYDGGVVSYSAQTMYDKNVYKNMLSLIANERPDLLESFQDENETVEYSLSVLAKKTSYMLFKPDDEISTEIMKEYDTSMYDTSNRLYALQYIYTHHLVKSWYDDILEKYGDRITKEELLGLVEPEKYE